MKSSSNHRAHPRCQLLTKEAQRALLQYEHTVICLMLLIAATSIMWSVSIHTLSGDFHHGIIGAKVVFCPRDFSQLDWKAKEVFHRDLEALFNGTYAADALEAEASRNIFARKEQEAGADKPRGRGIGHLFAPSGKQAIREAEPNDESEPANGTEVPRVYFDVRKDRQFLETMMVDIHQMRLRRNAAVQFINSFPFLSEIISIIWTAMCLVFQSGVKKYWGLPKPWRIVVPSILMFTLMSLSTGIYTLLAYKYLNNFCIDLRAQLSNPEALSCGQAVSVLRPEILQHKLSHDVYLNLFRVSYTLTLVLWLLALLIMVLRFTFAVDFQLTDAPAGKCDIKISKDSRRRRSVRTLNDVLLDSPQHQTPKLPVGSECRKSEDDFQSAKSHQSELAWPLLEDTKQPPTESIQSLP